MPDTGSPLGWKPSFYCMDEETEALQGDHTGRRSGGEFEPRVSGFHVHGHSGTPTLLTNEMSLADEGEGAEVMVLLHVCICYYTFVF